MNFPAGLRPAESDFALRAVQVALVNLVRVEHVLVLHPEAAVRHRGREIRQLALLLRNLLLLLLLLPLLNRLLFLR